MNKNSYRYLVPLIFGTLLSASLFVTWHSHIYSRTFFKPDLQQSYLIASSALAIITSLGMLFFKANITPSNTLKKKYKNHYLHSNSRTYSMHAYISHSIFTFNLPFHWDSKQLHDCL